MVLSQAVTADLIAQLAINNPDYHILAGRLQVHHLHECIHSSFTNNVIRIDAGEPSQSCMKLLLKLDIDYPTIFLPSFVKAVKTHGSLLDAALVHDRDSNMS